MQSTFVVLFLTIFGVLAVQRPTHPHPAPHSEDFTWDYLELVQQWWGTACREKHCLIKSLTHWTLHGLWPNRNDGHWPQFCPGEKYNHTEISSLLPELLEYWPSYFANSNDQFWEHEYDKHGTCAVYAHVPVFPDQVSYFKNALKAIESYPVGDLLAKAGIKPSLSSNYTVAQVSAALTVNGITPTLSCNKGMIETVAYCFNKGLQLEKCPNRVSGGVCTGSLEYPPGPNRK